MTAEERARMLATFREIALDTEADCRNFDGKPFTGRTVGTQFGNQGAAIAALANTVSKLIEEGS